MAQPLSQRSSRRSTCCAAATAIAATAFLSACATQAPAYGGPDPGEITVDYDPADGRAGRADREADGRCGGYGLSAVFVDETTDRSGGLRRRHYLCQ